jgi:hypothetical protein
VHHAARRRRDRRAARDRPRPDVDDDRQVERACSPSCSRKARPAPGGALRPDRSCRPPIATTCPSRQVDSPCPTRHRTTTPCGAMTPPRRAPSDTGGRSRFAARGEILGARQHAPPAADARSSTASRSSAKRRHRDARSVDHARGSGALRSFEARKSEGRADPLPGLEQAPSGDGSHFADAGD